MTLLRRKKKVKYQIAIRITNRLRIQSSKEVNKYSYKNLIKKIRIAFTFLKAKVLEDKKGYNYY